MSIERRELEIAGLKAHFYSPKGGGRSPAVIAVHGGGWRLLNLDNYRYLGPWLAERGYALLAVTYRLATPERKCYPEAVEDVRSALKFARSEAKLGVDPERIALLGDSSGAHLAALVALTEKQPVKAVIGVYGSSWTGQPGMSRYGMASSRKRTSARISRLLACPFSPKKSRSWPAISAMLISGMTVFS